MRSDQFTTCLQYFDMFSYVDIVAKTCKSDGRPPSVCDNLAFDHVLYFFQYVPLQTLRCSSRFVQPSSHLGRRRLPALAAHEPPAAAAAERPAHAAQHGGG